MDTRRQRRKDYPEPIRLGLLEDDVDELFRLTHHQDARLDNIDLWRARVGGMALLGSLLGGGVVAIIDLVVQVWLK